MKAATYRHRTYSARRCHRYAYPNQADPGYFAGKLLDGVTAVATGLGTVTLLLFLIFFF